MRMAGRMMQFVLTMVPLGNVVSFFGRRGADGNRSYRPMVMAVVAVLSLTSTPPSPERSGFRCKSPRMMTPAIITVRPPSMMFGLPSMWALREILLPVSWCWC
jgi:hypothetical protein